MKIKYVILYSFSLVFATITITQCSSSKAKAQQGIVKLEDKPSFVLGDVFFQKWVAGVQGGGSGYHLYLPVKENKKHVVFDSAFFRGLKAKLEQGKMGYIASFETALNRKPDLNMSGNKLDEYGNIFPYKLELTECVLSYIEKNEVKYFKVKNLIEKQAEYYPRVPPNEE
ncbi:hypothetical protein C1T31_00990 [Hanstruepera neustonica]|uniref:Lipoprotein n=1 Tax=Hanstruepera neustonica TaxID=1445657 RepID=A0A2K1E383_9FLAO|nr:hypothetical protein [Hanstruepera neustonica]PNQ74748.1 hypothetical protein C1T31_00990 [Hanstruepera neustonica]